MSYHFDGMSEQAHYFLCIGVSGKEYYESQNRSPDEPESPLAVFFTVFQFCSWLFWLFVNLKVNKEKKVLKKIQERTATSSGLPNLYSKHPGLSHMKKPIIFYSALSTFAFCQGYYAYLVKHDLIIQEPYTKFYAFASSSPYILSALIFPWLTINKNERVRESFNRRLREFVPPSVSSLLCAKT